MLQKAYISAMTSLLTIFPRFIPYPIRSSYDPTRELYERTRKSGVASPALSTYPRSGHIQSPCYMR